MISGIASCIGKSLPLIVLSRYFLKHRVFAVATATLGYSFSNFVSPLTANYLLDVYGFRGSSLIFGALLLNQCVAGALFHPVEWYLKPANLPNSNFANKKNDEELIQANQAEVDLNDKISLQTFPHGMMSDTSIQDNRTIPAFSDSSENSLVSPIVITETEMVISKPKEEPKMRKCSYSILKRIMVSTFESILTLTSMRIKIIAIGSACDCLGQSSFQFWISLVIRSAGYSLEVSAWCLSISSVTNIMGRVLMLLLSDRKWFNVKYVFMFSSFLIGISIIAFSIVKELKLFTICVCCWGFGIGIYITLSPSAYISWMRVEAFPSMLGVSKLFCAVSIISINPIVGIIYNQTSSYTYAISLLGVTVLIGFSAWLLMPLAIKYDENLSKGKSSKEVEEIV
ncbi:UNVERIFIED_CONTAM: hypothetical protein RMT77_002795 [Armadillidium vulgare]